MRVKTTIAVAALAALVLGLPASSHAKPTVTVGSGESIQAAVDAAKPGTTIKLEAGTYHESVVVPTSDIEIKGAGRKLTKIVPPSPIVEGHGCVFSEQREPPPAPPVLVASGICVANVDADFNIVKQVEDVEISNLTVTGFNEFGILLFGSRDGVVKRVILSDNGEYGVFANTSSGTSITRTVAGNNGEAGVYVGDSPNADATVWKNVSYGNNIGLFLRDAAHGRISDNKSFGNCAGVLFLNTDETAQQPPGQPIDAEDWVARDNDVTANNRGCAGGGEEGGPPLSGIGIGVSGGIDVRLIGNDLLGNKPDPTTGSEFSGGIVVAEGSKGTRAAFNTVLGNAEFDLFWDGTGEDNRFFANDCLTSQPDGLCEDVAGDDRDDDHAEARRRGGEPDSDHHAKRHKKHARHHRRHERHNRVERD